MVADLTKLPLSELDQLGVIAASGYGDETVDAAVDRNPPHGGES